MRIALNVLATRTAYTWTDSTETPNFEFGFDVNRTTLFRDAARRFVHHRRHRAG